MSKVSLSCGCCLLVAARALGGEQGAGVLIFSYNGQTLFPAVQRTAMATDEGQEGSEE